MNETTSDHTITVAVAATPDTEIEKVLVAGIVAYNVERADPHVSLLVSVAVRDGEGRVLGGVTGLTVWNWLYIRVLWLSDELRGLGFGRRVMAALEQEAVLLGCTNAYVDTMSFQAPGFYERLGYEVFGRLEDFPPGHTHFFLQKRLAAATPDG